MAILKKFNFGFGISNIEIKSLTSFSTGYFFIFNTFKIIQSEKVRKLFTRQMPSLIKKLVTWSYYHFKVKAKQEKIFSFSLRSQGPDQPSGQNFEAVNLKRLLLYANNIRLKINNMRADSLISLRNKQTKNPGCSEHTAHLISGSRLSVKNLFVSIFVEIIQILL